MILNTPALWGQVIDLDRLRRFGNRWVQKVVERAADAPQLCIKGTREWEKKANLCALFVEMLDQHWSKIQKLEISIENPLESKSNPNPWEPLRRPAPMLETFVVSFPYPNSKTPNKAGPPFFADHAPVLRVFRFSATPKVRITLQAPWMGQLSTLKLPFSFPATDTLDALAGMPHLETLEIKSVLEGQLGGLHQRKTVSLPCLKQLTITGTFAAAFLLVKFIVPASTCSLRLSAKDRQHGHIPSTSIRDMGNFLISRYLQDNFAQFRKLEIHNLAITEERINIIVAPPKTLETCLNLTIRCDTDISGLMYSHLLTPLLESGTFTRIDQFYLVHQTLKASVKKGFAAALRVIFSALPIASYMSVSEDALLLIIEVSPDLKKQLTWINGLTVDTFNSVLSEDFYDVLLVFLEFQFQVGKPVGDVHSSEFPDFYKKGVEKLTGFKMTWDGGEFVCGWEKAEKTDLDSE